MTQRLRAVWLLLLTALLVSAGGDPGLLLELDREEFELRVRDLRGRTEGPRLRVVLGSPAHPTPSGSYPLYGVVHEPRWTPGELARAAGARRMPASPSGPMGVAKIPFAGDGLALHGGAHPRLLGKPVSLGCVRMADPELLDLLDWLDGRRALGPRRPSDTGSSQQGFRRPVRLLVR